MERTGAPIDPVLKFGSLIHAFMSGYRGEPVRERIGPHVIVAVSVTGCDGRTGFGDAVIVHELWPTGPLVPLTAEVGVVLGVAFAHLSNFPDLLQTKEVFATVRVNPTRAHLVPVIDGLDSAATGATKARLVATSSPRYCVLPNMVFTVCSSWPR